MSKLDEGAMSINQPGLLRGSLGERLRAARLGYRYSERLQCWLRLRAGGPPWQVDLAPVGNVPNERKGARVRYLYWWWDPGLVDYFVPHVALPVAAPLSLRVEDEAMEERGL